MTDVSPMNTSNSVSGPSSNPGPLRPANFTGRIVKEGQLYKRGEHYRNWRSRYFFLLDDGSLIGFKSKPEPNSKEDPLNNFTVKGCQIMPTDKPKPYTFLIRGLQWTTVIERTFNVDTEREREEWIAAIKYVSEQVTAPGSSVPAFNSNQIEDVDMRPAEQITAEDLSEKFSVQGTSSSKSTGKRKVVSIEKID